MQERGVSAADTLPMDFPLGGKYGNFEVSARHTSLCTKVNERRPVESLAKRECCFVAMLDLTHSRLLDQAPSARDEWSTITVHFCGIELNAIPLILKIITDPSSGCQK